MDMSSPATTTLRHTQAVATTGMGPEPGVHGFQLDVVEGPAEGAHWESSSVRCAIGSCDACDLVVADPTVSRFHCEIEIRQSYARIRDLDSINGVFVDGIKVVEAYLRSGSLIRLGGTVLSFQLAGRRVAIPVSRRTEFGLMVGRSAAIRGAFALLERVAANDLPVLLEGETGTGKSVAAESIHRESGRARCRFFMVACSAIPENLLESELFGHVKGAFSDAVDRAGAFEEADGGTLFLDEIGDMPLSLQAKLLTALDAGEFRRIGSNRLRKADIRFIAATHRDLRAEVNAGRFREDLYFRIAVLPVRLPPLRERLDDLPDLIMTILSRSRLAPPAERLDALLCEGFLATLRASAWPGNIRELRNYLERCLAFDLVDTSPATEPRQPAADSAGIAVPFDLPYKEARKRLHEEFERRYITELLRRHEGNVSRAAETAGIGREYVHRLIRAHGIDRSGGQSD
jgi:two-component system, NtrC family, response regulator GlrR